MPRALTEREKEKLRGRIIEKGKGIVFALGVKKVSVDDIATAAGVAKGTFYQHFKSKESFLYELIWGIHNLFFKRAEEMVIGSADLRGGVCDFLIKLFQMPGMIFFFQNSDLDLIFDYASSSSGHDGPSLIKMEEEGYSRLLTAAGFDTDKVKPGVVHNYFHALYLMKSSDLMIKDSVQETFEIMIDGLVNYIFGGAV